MPPEPAPRLDRRQLLLGAAGLAGLVLLGGCGSGDGAQGGDDADHAHLDLERLDGRPSLVANFNPQGRYIATGIPQRLTFVVADADGIRSADVPSSLEFTLKLDGQVVGEPITVDAHGDGLAAPYFPLVTTFDRPGFYTAAVTLDGRESEQVFTVDVPSDVPVLQVGAPMPPVDTPTVDDHRGVEPICTDEPECPLHAQTLQEALGTGQPTALLVSTPQFCRTGLCGPVLDLLVEQVGSHPGIQFIHAEVYADAVATGNPATAQRAPIIDALGLDFEPSLFLVDGGGTIVARLDNVYDRTELTSALSSLG